MTDTDTESPDVCVNNLSDEAKMPSSYVYDRIRKQMLRFSEEKLLVLYTGMLAFSFQVTLCS